MTLKRLMFPAFVAVSVLAASAAHAATATDNLTVQMTITAACSVTGGTLDFGTAQAGTLAANRDAQTNISVTCTSGSPYSVGLGAGQNGGGAGINGRAMKRGTNADTIAYQLYRDTGRAAVWGEDVTPTTGNTFNQSGAGTAQSIPVYGRVPTGTAITAAGIYTDTVTITLTY